MCVCVRGIIDSQFHILALLKRKYAVSWQCFVGL